MFSANFNANVSDNLGIRRSFQCLLWYIG